MASMHMASSDDKTAFWCVSGLAAVSGIIISVAVNVVAYGAHLREEAKTQPNGSKSSCRWYEFERSLIVVNMILNLVGIGVFMFASSFGAIAVAVPAETAVLLLSNLTMQQLLGIGKFDMTCLRGTLVLCAATACLKDVGPVVATDIDVFLRIWTPASLAWLFFTLILGLASLFFIHSGKPSASENGKLVNKTNAFEPLLQSSHGDSDDQGCKEERRKERLTKLVKTCAYALGVAVATALGSSVGKMITQANGVQYYYCFGAYGLCGLGSLYYGAKAAEECDQSEYLPINECIKLVINAITGFVVWGDHIRYPSTYLMVYLLLCLGASLCASEDLVGAQALKERNNIRREISNQLFLEEQTAEGNSSPVDSPFQKGISP